MLTIFLPIIILLLLNTTRLYISLWITSIISLIGLTLISLFTIPRNYAIIITPFIILDQIRTLLISLTLWITALIFIASQKIYINNLHLIKFTTLLIALTLTLVLAFSTRNITLFYIIFEASLIPTLLLILGWGYQPERLQAGAYLILYTITASLPLLLALIIINNISHHRSIIIPFWTLLPNRSLHQLWWIITIIAFLVKTPIFLTHLWLPKAHVEAPVAGSIILAGILLKLGGYGLLRISRPLFHHNRKISFIIIRIRLVGAVVARFICVRQTDVKSLIAYSSVSHIGLVTAGIISNTSWGWQGALVIMLAHGLCSSCIFALANITYETTQTRRIFITKGMIILFPAITFWWFIFSAANIAAPPSMNLMGEIILLTRILSYSFTSSVLIALIRFIAAAYSLFLYTSTQHGQTPTYLNPLSLFTQRNYSICLMHGVPIISLVIKIDIISLWF